MNGAPKPAPVPHSLNCLCRACVDARRDERDARLEEQHREGRRHELALLEDAAGRGVVFKPAKVRAGTLPALAKIGRAV